MEMTGRGRAQIIEKHTIYYDMNKKSNWNLCIIQDVPKPMSQTSPGYSPPLIKKKSSYQHGSKSEQVPRYPLTVMCGYPLSIT